MNASEEIAQTPTSAPPTAESITRARRERILYVLVAAHVVLGIVAARLVDSSSMGNMVLFLAYFFSAGGLLGLWAALAVAWPLCRLAGAAVGILYLGLLPCLWAEPPPGDDAGFFLLLAALSAAPPFLVENTFRNLPAGEQRELLGRLSRSLRSEAPPVRAARQKAAAESLFEILDKLPMRSPDDGWSSENHDDILYGEKS